jgi:uncharacterized membrane protein
VSRPTAHHGTREGDQEVGVGLGRILALSDGVFAIALTLLVLDIALPRPATGSLTHELLHLYPRYLAYALSFAVIARFWLAHHFTYRYVHRYDTPLIVLNLVFLFLVAFLPFPTRVIGQHGDKPAAAVLYAASVVLASVASGSLWWYATGPGRLVRHDTPRAQVRAGRARSIATIAVFALSIPVALVLPYAAEMMWVLAFPLSRVAWRWAARRTDPTAELADKP